MIDSIKEINERTFKLEQDINKLIKESGLYVDSIGVYSDGVDIDNLKVIQTVRVSVNYKTTGG